jgi:tetratricopeptide (TPR) repeat protein
MASRRGLLESGPVENLLALAWERGGWIAADLVRSLETAAPVFFILIVAVLLSGLLPEKWKRPARWIWIAGVLLIFSWGLWNGWKAWLSAVREPRLLAPLDLFERAQGQAGRIFFNPNALFHAALFAPGKIENEMSFEQSAKLQSSLADWRAEDRKDPFSGIVFAGADVRASPFLEMVRSMPGWSLAKVDNHGLFFVRESTVSEPANRDLAKEKFAEVDTQALYLAQAAMIQQAIGQPEKARELFSDAFEISQTNPHVLVLSAHFAASEGRWADTLEAVRSVLKKNPWSIQARYLEALALFESGSLSKAVEKSHALAESRPNDSAILGLQARVAAQNNDPATEIAALEKLVSLAKRRGQPAGDFHALLGQAWARRGFPDQAMANYQAALDANPPADVRKQIEESMEVIRRRTR